MTQELKTKGSHVIQVRAWLDERLGAGWFDRAMREAQPGWNALVLPGQWQDALPLIAVLERAVKELRGGPASSVESITTAVAAINAREDLPTIYKTFLRLAAPVRVMSFTPQLWRNYVAFGEARAVKNEPGIYLGECSGLPARTLDWVCGAWLGFIPTAIEIAGGKNATGRIVERVPVRPGAEVYRIALECRYAPP